MTTTLRWMSTEQAALEAGMTTEWVRRQISAGRLDAVAFETGRRRTYRISTDAWERFLGRFSHSTRSPDDCPGGEDGAR